MQYCNMKAHGNNAMDYFLRKSSRPERKPIIKKRVYFNRALKGVEFTNIQLIARFLGENKKNASKIQRYIDNRFTYM